MLKEPPQRPSPETARASGSTLQAKRPNHVWHIDLTVVPTSGGFWCAWLPWALPQRWPFCWWVGVVLDHSSRRVLGMATFPQQPTSIAVRAFLGRTIRSAKATPKHLICDSGRQFRCAGFRRWARGKHIGVRFGAIGQQGSLAVLERFFLTLKNEGTRRLLVALKRERFTKQLRHFTTWYNAHRPHMTHGGQTPDEVYYEQQPANSQPRVEPRTGWPTTSPCAAPRAPVSEKPGVKLAAEIRFLGGCRNLPIVTLRKAA
jgi:transposase InsO family protein